MKHRRRIRKRHKRMALLAVIALILLTLIVLLLVRVFSGPGDLNTTPGNAQNEPVLSARELLDAHFIYQAENREKELNETVLPRWRGNWTLQNLNSLEVTLVSELSLSAAEIEDYYGLKEDDYAEACTFDVTFNAQYRKNDPRESGVRTWRYLLIRENTKAPWIIHSFG